MKRLRELNQFRDRAWERSFSPEPGDDFGGCFRIPRHGVTLECIAGTGDGWDHVSVKPGLLPRTPSWSEMEYIKRAFFKPEEVAFQLHVATANHISVNPYVLHIWRPQDGLIPTPPSWMV